jgi:hypothetical protein
LSEYYQAKARSLDIENRIVKAAEDFAIVSWAY